MLTKPLICIRVLDFMSDIIKNAQVVLVSKNTKGKDISLSFSDSLNAYVATESLSGDFLIKVSSASFQPDSRQVNIDRTGLDELFILGYSGMPFLYRGKVRVPFESKEDLVGVILREQDSKTEKVVISFASKLGLTEEKKVIPNKAVSPALIFRFKAKLDRSRKEKILSEVSTHSAVVHAGSVVNLHDEGMTFLTNELVVKLKSSSKQKENALKGLLSKGNFEIVQRLDISLNTYVIRSNYPASYRMLELCDSLVKNENVEWAEQNLATTTVLDAINPADTLFAQQWHHGLVNTPEAWQRLHNFLGVNRQFGDPDILISVFDPSGIQTVHPDLSGVVSSGDNKVFAQFNFVNNVANMNNLSGDHGTECAGIATARADNGSVVPGENEGVAGAAGNCRLIAVRNPGTEVGYSNAYQWAAGLANLPGQPGTQLAIGASVISNSFGASVGLPISATMSNTFDNLTNNGRNGLGCVLCFSTGNFLPRVEFTLERPWAAYNRTMAVGASTLGNDGLTEIISDYSGFGGAAGVGSILDVVAPSHDTYVGGSPLHNPPINYATITTTRQNQGNLAGHTGGNMDYTDAFGGTSSATPLVAGIAALVISADPTRTWTQVRDILRNTATKIDYANTNATDQYFDLDGDGTAEYSRSYGYGRVNANLAVASVIPKNWLKDFKDADKFRRIEKSIRLDKSIVLEKRQFKEKDRIDEVKGFVREKFELENFEFPFEEVINPGWFSRLENRLGNLETQTLGKHFISKDERPEVGSELAQKAKKKRK